LNDRGRSPSDPARRDRIIDIDLTAGCLDTQPVSPETIARLIGGRGLNVAHLMETVSADTDPLGPDNPLTITCGLLTGTAAPASSRIHINARSPLTGLLGSANVGGGMGDALRRWGVFSLRIRGVSAEPVCLVIGEDGITIRPADMLWGLDTWETIDRVRERLGDPSASVMAIGPAGESLARIACITVGRDHAAGRTGMGAVMGAKRLKAIVAQTGDGSRRPSPPADTAAVRRYARRIREAGEFRFLSTHGGAGYVKWCDEMGMMATRNYRANRFEGIDRLDGTRLSPHVTRSRGCPRCPVRCKADLTLKGGRHRGAKVSRPEFEPMINLGSKCGLDDPTAVAFLDTLCTRQGVDSISAGGAIAFAMDLWERGLLKAADTGGLDLRWGNADAMETLIRQMGRGTGLGGILAGGVRRAAAIIGRGSERYAAHVKGLELTGYHPRDIMGTALGYAVSSRGGDYNNVYASMEYRWPAERAAAELGTPLAIDLHAHHGKAPLVKRATIVNIALDCLGICKVPSLSLIGTFDLVSEAELATALTGQPITPEGLFEVGERVCHLERRFNIECGLRPEDDRLPPMFLDADYSGGRGPNQSIARLDEMVAAYYAAMGWDPDGRPQDAPVDPRLDGASDPKLSESPPNAGPDSPPGSIRKT
jgi:aldehyde:ferredoxin oxidoreductase